MKILEKPYLADFMPLLEINAITRKCLSIDEIILMVGANLVYGNDILNHDPYDFNIFRCDRFV